MSTTASSVEQCFVPEILVKFIEKSFEQGKETLEPSSYFLKGVCLLVDISGFTKLSGEFCDRGKIGIDDLQLTTNGYMGKLVEVIYTFGGDIIKFAGDALVCLFSPDLITALSFGTIRGSFCGFEASFAVNSSHQPSESTMMLEVVLRAMDCARALSAVHTDKLSVHVAISCGEVCFGILGGVENRWECLISGTCLHQLSPCLDEAASKEAVITADCAAIIDEAIKEIPESNLGNGRFALDTVGGQYEFAVQTLPSGNQKIIDIKCKNNLRAIMQTFSQSTKSASLRKKPVFAELIKRFVPIPIADELEKSASLGQIAEIREVTTMFMKWDSYDATSLHRDLMELQPCFYQAQRVLHSTGAFLRQFLVDDKGCVLIACWGMPHMSYLDNTNRALTASAQIRTELGRFGMSCSFGITTGDVYCGTVGSALRMEYAAIGSVVNMSARLMAKAQGGILIDDATYARLPNNMLDLLEALEPMKVKGRDTPLVVYRFIARDLSRGLTLREEAVQDHQLSTVCRNALTSMLNNMGLSTSPYASRRSRRASSSTFNVTPKLPVVILTGKEGSGKATSVVWLRKQAQQRALSMINLRLNKKDSLTDYAVWRRIFPMLMPKDLFVNVKTQEKYIRVLLKEVYPDDPAKAMKVAMPVLRSVLGITCTLREQERDRESSQLTRSTRSSRSIKMFFSTGSKLTYTGPPVPVQDTLVTIFSHLLTAETHLVVIQSIELADENSLKVLLGLISAGLATRSAIVLTSLSDPAAPDARRGALFTKFFQSKTYVEDEFHGTSWESRYKAALLKQKTTTLVSLENYTIDEMDKMLCDVLGVRTVPAEIASLVHDFSGGSYFWVREIINFLKEHGPEQFMEAVGEQQTATEAVSDFLEAVEGGAVGIASSSRDQGPVSPPNSPPAPMQRTLSPAPGPLQRAVSNAALVHRGMPAGAPLQRGNSMMRPLARGQSFKTLNASRGPQTHFRMKLNKLIIARFEGLHSDVQRILRTASIIGMTFSQHVLYGVLPAHLKPEMAACIKVMLNSKWLYQDTDDLTMYQFVHAHAHQLIYELTPTSERKNIHNLVAQYIEDTSGDDKAQYALLSFHYQHYDPDKALRYAVQATPVLLESESIFDFSDCVDLLLGSYECCKTSYDVEVLKKLVTSATKTIQKFEAKSAQPEKVNWWDRVKSFVRPRASATVGVVQNRRRSLGEMFGAGGWSMRSSGTNRSADKYVPGVSASGGSGGSNAKEGDSRRRDGSGRVKLSGVTPLEQQDEELDAPADALSYEQRLQRNILDQLAGLTVQLDEKLEQFYVEGVLTEVKDWQRSILGIPVSAKYDRKFGLLRASGSKGTGGTGSWRFRQLAALGGSQGGSGRGHAHIGASASHGEASVGSGSGHVTPLFGTTPKAGTTRKILPEN